MYTVRLLKSASRGLERLDPIIAKRVINRLHWLAENLNNINPEPLKGQLRGFYKLREGYRIAYEILRQEQVIIVHLIGHRRDIYRVRG